MTRAVVVLVWPYRASAGALLPQQHSIRSSCSPVRYDAAGSRR